MENFQPDLDPDEFHSAPLVVGPSVAELERLSDELHLGLRGDAVLDDYQSIISDALEGLNKLEELVEPNLPVKYPRTPGYRPSKAENPHNGWYYKSRIEGAPSGILSGKRVAIKDSIAVAGVPLMAGCYALQGYVPDFDATVVTRLLDAGSVILGKATCDELCYSLGTSSTSATGHVINPVGIGRDAGGSSSGCAALVASGEVDIAIGADQGGSIRLPASWCGVVGLKPTFGLVPYTGASSRGVSIDHMGPITRTVEDCALALEVIAGYDEGNDSRQPCNLQVPSYSKELKNLKTDTIRIGVLQQGFGHPRSDPNVDEHIRSIVKAFASSTGACVEGVSIPLHCYVGAIGQVVSDIGAMDTIFNTAGVGLHGQGFYPTSMMQAAGSRLKANWSKLHDGNKIQLLSSKYLKENYCHLYGKAQNLTKLLTQAYDEVLAKYDVVVMPTVPYTAPPLMKKGVTVKEQCLSTSAITGHLKAVNLTGHPAISVPAGRLGGLPVGLQLSGRKFDEVKLLQIAYAFEQFMLKQKAE